MRVTINGEAVGCSLENESNLQEVLASLRDTLVSNRLLPMRIAVDGRPVDLENAGSVPSLPIEGIGEIAVTAVTSVEAGAALFSAVLRDLDALPAKLEEATILFQQGKDAAGLERVTETSAVLERTLSSLGRAVDLTETSRPDHPTIAEVRGKVKPVLQEINAALESNDLVLLGDLLEYDLTEAVRSLRSRVAEAREALGGSSGGGEPGRKA
jgi:hypothetical protein